MIFYDNGIINCFITNSFYSTICHGNLSTWVNIALSFIFWLQTIHCISLQVKICIILHLSNPGHLGCLQDFAVTETLWWTLPHLYLGHLSTCGLQAHSSMLIWGKIPTAVVPTQLPHSSHRVLFSRGSSTFSHGSSADTHSGMQLFFLLGSSGWEAGWALTPTCEISKSKSKDTTRPHESALERLVGLEGGLQLSQGLDCAL